MCLHIAYMSVQPSLLINDFSSSVYVVKNVALSCGLMATTSSCTKHSPGFVVDSVKRSALQVNARAE